MHTEKSLTFIAQTNGRHPHHRFGIKPADRFFHMYAVGKTGTGKSTLLESLALQDMQAGHGIAVIDPHGDMVSRLATQVPAHRADDLLYFNTPDVAQPFGYNPLRKVRRDKIPLAASGLMEAFKLLWPEAWGVRMEHVLRNALFALIEYGEATVPDILTLITDRQFRTTVLTRVSNVQVKEFWTEEFPKYNPRYRQEVIAPIQNKVGAFLADPRLYRILTTPTTDIRIRHAMDTGKILLVNLCKGQLGDDSAGLLGALLVTTIALAAFSRAEVPEHERRPFFLYIDEFQSFTTLSLANMVSELRKWNVGLILAHQHLHQLQPEILHAILGNVGTTLVFRLGAEDARFFAREFDGVFNEHDFTNLANYDVCMRLMIDGVPSRPFSATTLPPQVLS